LSAAPIIIGFVIGGALVAVGIRRRKRGLQPSYAQQQRALLVGTLALVAVAAVSIASGRYISGAVTIALSLPGWILILRERRRPKNDRST